MPNPFFDFQQEDPQGPQNKLMRWLHAPVFASENPRQGMMSFNPYLPNPVDYSPNQRVHRGHTEWWEDLPESTNVEDRRSELDKLFDQRAPYYVPNGMDGATPLNDFGVNELQGRFRNAALDEREVNAPVMNKLLWAFLNGMMGRSSRRER